MRELEGALNKVIAHSTLVGRPLTLDFVHLLLKDLLRPQSKPLTMQEIEKRVCDHFQVRVTDLHSAKRTRCISRPRQVAMFLAKSITPTSLPMIGKHFGGRDHSTVIYALQSVSDMIDANSKFKYSIEELRKKLKLKNS